MTDGQLHAALDNRTGPGRKIGGHDEPIERPHWSDLPTLRRGTAAPSAVE
jgi:hypothetical protein